MVTPDSRRIKRYIDGVAPQIQGMVTTSNLASIQATICLAHKLTNQGVAQGTMPAKKTDANTSWS
jgi:hypothetical protein